MDLNKTILDIIENSGKDFDLFGVRVINNPGKQLSIGDELTNSFDWVDGEHTDSELYGACAITINYDGDPENMDIEYDLDQVKTYIKSDDYAIVLVTGDSVEYGEDESEIILSNPVVAYVF